MSLGYVDRLTNYLKRRPNYSSAPELTHLTARQRRRLTHKLGRHKRRAIQRKGLT